MDTRCDINLFNICLFFQSEGGLQKKFTLNLDTHEVGELGYEVCLILQYLHGLLRCVSLTLYVLNFSEGT